MQTKIEVTGGTVVVTGPFSESNNEQYRALGGKFTGGAWRLPDNDNVRQHIAELFGSASDLVDVEVPLDSSVGKHTRQIGGYVLASRRGRDYPVRMPDGVSLISGSFPERGGSVKNPRVCADASTVFRLTCRESFAVARGLKVVVPTTSTINI